VSALRVRVLRFVGMSEEKAEVHVRTENDDDNVNEEEEAMRVASDSTEMPNKTDPPSSIPSPSPCRSDSSTDVANQGSNDGPISGGGSDDPETGEYTAAAGGSENSSSHQDFAVTTVVLVAKPTIVSATPAPVGKTGSPW